MYIGTENGLVRINNSTEAINKRYNLKTSGVKYDKSLNLNILDDYLTTQGISNNQLFNIFQEYKTFQTDIQKLEFKLFLDYITGEKLLINNRSLFNDIITFLEYCSEENQIHRERKEKIINNLIREFFSGNLDLISTKNLKSLEELDYSQYESNNFRITNENNVINDIYAKGGAIFLDLDGKICCRFSKNGEVKVYSKRQAEIILSKELKYAIKITEEIASNTGDNKMTKKNKPETLYIQDLLLVHGNKFKPRVLREYFEEDGVYYKNSFKPTKYMQLVGKPERFPKTIIDFIFHLVNYKEDNFNYFINNLAYFFKYLKKSQVAIALIGEQGAGKGILFENIISELFGREYCITINNDSINSSYKAKIIKDKLYYSFDEVKLKTSEKNDSFIKAIITNPSISLEEKNVTMNKEIELFGQCIFSSNNMDALKIEESDRRFTVIKTSVNISKTNFLNYGSYDALIEGIRVDLEDFAKYLKNYDVDIKLANTVLDTVEKRVILNSQKNNLAEFHTAIINSNIDYFKDIWILDSELYTNLKVDFMENKINRANIAKAYNLLFSKKMSSKEILKELRTIPPYEIFSEKNNLKHSGNDHYFSLSR